MTVNLAVWVSKPLEAAASRLMSKDALSAHTLARATKHTWYAPQPARASWMTLARLDSLPKPLLFTSINWKKSPFCIKLW
jgi:hypothetical protein